jgi:ABC-type lipoprotein export system ATPase subunit
VITVRDVHKTFEDGRIRALDGISFEVANGELVAITGPSGSGKSTLLNLIGGLDRPDSGEIRIDGEDVLRLDRARTFGFVFQFHELIGTLTALENVQIPMLGRRGRAERERRARGLLDEVGLGDRLRSRPSTLSGGERQRVAIARALANEPRVLLADEPTGALDSDAGAEIVALLRRLQTTILLVTNDDAVAAQADRSLRLSRAAALRSG